MICIYLLFLCLITNSIYSYMIIVPINNRTELPVTNSYFYLDANDYFPHPQIYLYLEDFNNTFHKNFFKICYTNETPSIVNDCEYNYIKPYDSKKNSYLHKHYYAFNSVDSVYKYCYYIIFYYFRNFGGNFM